MDSSSQAHNVQGDPRYLLSHRYLFDEENVLDVTLNINIEVVVYYHFMMPSSGNSEQQSE